MSTAAHFTKAELMAPPQAQTIQMRSFWIGVAFAAIVLFGIWRAPEAVYPAYLILTWAGSVSLWVVSRSSCSST